MRSSREVPHGSPLAHHRAYGPRTTAVCPSIERGMAGGRIEQSELAEPSAVDGDLRLQRISQTPPPAAGGGQLAGGSRRDPVLSEESAPSRGLLALFEPHAAQLAAPPAIQAAQLAVCLGVTEGRHPSGQVGIGLVDHLPQADRRLRDLTQARLGALDTLRRDAEGAVCAQPVVEELALPDRGRDAMGRAARSWHHRRCNRTNEGARCHRPMISADASPLWTRIAR